MPPESSDSDTAARASTAGLRNVIGLTSGPIRGSDVSYASPVRQDQASNHGAPGSSHVLPRWSATQIVSTPSSSTSCQRATSSGHGAFCSVMTRVLGPDRVRDAYRADTYERLRALKREYDPGNLFRLNQNVRPD